MSKDKCCNVFVTTPSCGTPYPNNCCCQNYGAGFGNNGFQSGFGNDGFLWIIILLLFGGLGGGCWF